jgi:hypothetical protein
MKTQLDIYNAAHAAATANISITDPVQAAQASLDAFKASGGSSADFDLFNTYFKQRRAAMMRMAKIPSASSNQKPKA